MTILKIDIDIDYHRFKKYIKPYYEEVVKHILSTFNIKVKKFRYYSSPRGKTHVYIEIDREVKPIYIPILQFLCYSDHRRENYNLIRMEILKDAWTDYNVLFQDKKQKGLLSYL